MAIKVGGTEVVSNSRELKNIATIDSGTVTAFNSALNTDPTKGTLTKTFTQNETAEITLNSNVTVGPVVSATKEVPQTGVSTKGNWDVNSTASNYDFHSTAANVTLTPSTSPDLASSTYANVSVGVGGNYGPRFSSDGTKVFMNNEGQNYIRQRTLSTAWDLSTTSSVASFSTASQVNDETGFCFSGNGLHFYLCDQNGSGSNMLHQYSITSGYPYDLLNYGSFTRTANMTSLGEAAPATRQIGSVLVEDSGTKMYIFSGSGSSALIRQYTLSTAYDISSATYANKSFDVHADYGSGGYLGNSSLSSDGTILLLANGRDDIVMHYELSTAWDISTASRVGTYNPSEDANVGGIHLRPNNSEFFMLGGSSTTIYKYTLGSNPSLALGSGSFSATDVGKRITGNGGDVVLTSTGGAFDTTGGSAFTDSSTIAAGSWQMFGLKSAGDALGITMSGKSSSGNYTLLDTTDGHAHKVTLGTTNASGLQGFTIDPNGLYLYAVSSQDDRLRRYDFGTAWDLSTLNTTATSGQVVITSGYDGGCVDVAFNPTGTKMYVAGQDSDFIYQWNLSTAWDLSTASYTGSLNVQGSVRVNGGFNGLFVTPDGTKLYTVCRNTDRLARWNFDSSQNVVNASYDSAHWVGGVNSYPHDIAWNPDGSAMYLSGNNSGFYKWNATTAFEISSNFVNDSSFSVTVNTNAVEGFFIKPDETKIYTMYNNEISQWNIGSFTLPTAQYHVGVTNSGGRIDSSAFVDINSMTAAQVAGTGTVNYAVSTDGRTTWSVAKGTDGVRPIVRNNSGTWQYNSAESSFGISTASYTGKSFNVNSQEPNATGVFFKPDGTKMYVNGYSNDDVNEYNLSTAWDITTATYSQNFNLSSQDTVSTDIFFRPDGLRFWMVGSNSDRVREYYISTAWDISTASYVRDTALPSGQQNPQGIFFKSDGTKMYVAADNGSAFNVLEYSLSSGWNVASATYVQAYTITQDSNVQGVWLNNDGTKMFVLGDANQSVYEYNLSTAYDVSTASYSNNSFSVNTQLTGPRGLFFKPDGSNMYVVGADNNLVVEYNTLSYGTSATWTNGTVNDELYTLQEALSVGTNRMDKTQLDAIPDANHFATGSSLDLMIALRMDAAASTLPTSDGVTLNYDSASLNEGAVLGTDYDFFHPAANKVQIKSLAAQNLKVRVV